VDSRSIYVGNVRVCYPFLFICHIYLHYMIVCIYDISYCCPACLSVGRIFCDVKFVSFSLLSYDDK
jgi:hypothetical protein